MALLSSLFGKKKKEIKAQCPITKERIENGFGYMLTTAQVIASKKYWDMIMTEPETLSYTISHFKNQSTGTQMRNMIFEKYSGVNKPWIISDSCINLFEEVDKATAKENAKKWWANEGNYTPEQAGTASERLDQQTYKSFKDYAVLEAGRGRVMTH
jgi:hypothetical protein